MVVSVMMSVSKGIFFILITNTYMVLVSMYKLCMYSRHILLSEEEEATCLVDM